MPVLRTFRCATLRGGNKGTLGNAKNPCLNSQAIATTKEAKQRPRAHGPTARFGLLVGLEGRESDLGFRLCLKDRTGRYRGLESVTYRSADGDRRDL